MKTLLKKIIPDVFIRALWHFPRAVLANVLFVFPAHTLTCIAIAGTKGKTSTSVFLAHLLNAAGRKTALFSTAAVSDGTHESLNVWKMTTPDVFTIQRFLHNAIHSGSTHAVLEVSSHALKQYRVWGIPFSVVVITNLEPDHLEYHASADEYVGVHQKLFSRKTKGYCVPDELHSTFNIQHGTSFRTSVRNPEHDDGRVWWLPLQRANLNTALCAARALGLSDEECARAIETLPAPPGRFESIDEGQPFRVIVDYAHSPGSLEYFLSRVRPLVSGTLWVVFGACGDRDKDQRPVMAAVLERYADHIILTTDDPYSEQPKDIARDVECGFTKTGSGAVFDQKTAPDPVFFTTILDRKEAISYALSHAQPDDCVCILGKGAEQWQIFKDKKIPWDDRVVARDIIRARA
ncbi:MAG: UDP-N-acetylmuramoyl-L-alanyl-D-glutamate--2,6-diaminopimelate ligase [Patescibacteria group bacterium]